MQLCARRRSSLYRLEGFRSRWWFVLRTIPSTRRALRLRYERPDVQQYHLGFAWTSLQGDRRTCVPGRSAVNTTRGRWWGGHSRFDMLDATGRAVLTRKLPQQTGESILPGIPLAQGVYTVVLMTDREVVASRKLIIAH